MLHKDLIEDEIHQIHDKEFATRSSREAHSYVSTDIGKIVRQTDEDSYYLVKSATPTFLRIDNGESIATSTTDATVTTLYTFTMPDNASALIQAEVTGLETDGSNRNNYIIAGAFYRDGGNATQQGSTVSILSIESDATWGAVEFAVSGNDVIVRATGAASTNITWISETKVNLAI